MQSSNSRLLLWIVLVLGLGSCVAAENEQIKNPVGRFSLVQGTKQEITKEVHKHFAVNPVACVETTLILRSDSTFIIGYCERQVFETGDYHFADGKLHLTGTYNFMKRQNVPDRAFFFDEYKRQILFVQPPYLTDQQPDSAYIFSVLREATPTSAMYIRNEHLSKDSLLRYNVFWPKARQLAWLDSINKRSN